ncbi:putative membrane protein [Cardiosporidium cionae]|uniref:Membrane protein n=1 Tax=Cardiosporidium cionae TaxID=476202 RepID=A0ABQ7JGC7_9APIC|nr:putative membrane protein [Cardiosporidium cionae]|eukprot:KAF8823031.1 putative membrane protein [Cardiosporidium cionae]
MDFNYRPVPFQPSRLPTKISNQISLIKVPRFLSEKWKTSEDRSIIGTVFTCAETGSIQVSQKVDEATSQDAEFTSQPAQNCRVCVMQQNLQNPCQADILCQLNQTQTLTPILSKNYFSLLKNRKKNLVDAHRRQTIEERRHEYDLDTSQTLFRYYAPKGDSKNDTIGEESPRFVRTSSTTNRVKSKAKKLVTMDEDSLKIRLFQLFEKKGVEGVQLKQLVNETDQPLAYVKGIVDEIAEQRKRASDRKLVYFLKDCYKASSGPEEEPPSKRTKYP